MFQNAKYTSYTKNLSTHIKIQRIIFILIASCVDRDMEYVKRLNQPQQDSANNECSGVAEWSNENKFRNVCVDVSFVLCCM